MSSLFLHKKYVVVLIRVAEELLMSTTTFFFVEKEEKYQYFLAEKAPYLKRSSTFNINPFMPSRLFYLNSLDRYIPYIRGVRLVLIIVMFHRNFWT